MALGGGGAVLRLNLIGIEGLHYGEIFYNTYKFSSYFTRNRKYC
jgi:hypothetical protein